MAPYDPADYPQPAADPGAWMRAAIAPVTSGQPLPPDVAEQLAAQLRDALDDLDDADRATAAARRTLRDVLAALDVM